MLLRPAVFDDFRIRFEFAAQDTASPIILSFFCIPFDKMDEEGYVIFENIWNDKNSKRKFVYFKNYTDIFFRSNVIIC